MAMMQKQIGVVQKTAFSPSRGKPQLVGARATLTQIFQGFSEMVLGLSGDSLCGGGEQVGRVLGNYTGNPHHNVISWMCLRVDCNIAGAVRQVM